MNQRSDGEGMERRIWSDGGMEWKQKTEVHDIFKMIVQNQRQNDLERIDGKEDSVW